MSDEPEVVNVDDDPEPEPCDIVDSDDDDCVEVDPPTPVAKTDDELAAEAAALKATGNDYYKKGDYYKAIDFYTRAIDTAPATVPTEKATYYGNRAAAYQQLRKFEETVKDCQQALALDAGFTKGYLRAGQAQLQLGNTDEARPLLERALQLDAASAARDDLRALREVEEETARARQELDAGNARSAFSSLSSALRHASQSRTLRLWKAEAYIALEQVNEGLATASDILREDRNNVEALFLRGLAKYYLDEPDQAATHFRQALQFDPDHKRSGQYLKLSKNLKAKKEEGNDHFRAARYDAAVASYTAALQLDPGNKKVTGTLYSNRAAALSKLRRHRECVDDCTKAIEIDSNNLKAYVRRAAAYMELEEYQTAVYDYTKARDMDPTNRERAQDLRRAQTELKKSQRKDLYKILGVPKDAPDRAIKLAYKKKALQWHPDKNMESEEQKRKAELMFRDVNEAYSILSDPEKRAQYDEGHDITDINSGQAGHGGGFGHMDPNEIFSMFGGQFGGGFGGMHGGFRFG